MDQDLVTGALQLVVQIPRCQSCGAVDDVEELAERHARRAHSVRPFVSAAERDDEVVGRSKQRVEQELAIFTPEIAVTDARHPFDDVVAVGRGPSGEDAVVETE